MGAAFGAASIISGEALPLRSAADGGPPKVEAV
jgi:hypothetical protein